MTTLRIPHRFRGPAESGNGGYSAGVFAQTIAGPARVRLKAPPPLDTDLSVDARGDAVHVMHGDIEVAMVRPGRPDATPPTSPGLEAAADCATRYAGRDTHLLPECFVCGTGREAGDGLRLFTGPDEGGTLVAAPWRATADLGDDAGLVRSEIVWAALDCPGYFAMREGPVMALLGEITAEIVVPPEVGQDIVVIGWPIGGEGRKRYAGSALFDAEGGLLARAEATWIILKS